MVGRQRARARSRASHENNDLESFAEEQLLRRQLEAVSDATLAIGAGASLERVLQLLVDGASQVAGAQYAVIAIGTDPTRPFGPYAQSGFSPEQIKASGQEPHPVGVRGLVAREGRVVRVPDVRRHPAFAGFPPGHPEMTSFLGVPLCYRERSVGNLYLANKRNAPEFTEADQRAIELLAAHAGVALQQARLHEEVQTERARLQTVLQSAAHGISVVDAQTQREVLNGRAIEILGRPPAPEADLTWYEGRVFDPDGQPMAAEALPATRALRGETVPDEEVLLERPDGRRVPLLMSAAPVRDAQGNVAGAVMVFQDITKRKRVEQALRKSEDSLARAQAIAHLGSWDLNLDTDELRWSDEIYRIFGLTPQAFGATYQAFLESVHPEDRAGVRAALNRALYEYRPYSIDRRILRPDGSKRIVHEEAEVIRDDSGRPVRMIGTVQDVTEQRQAAAERERLLGELRAEEQRLSAVIQTSPVGVLLVEGPAGERLTANPWAERLFGRPLQPDQGNAQVVGLVCRPDKTPFTQAELASSRALRGEVLTGEEQLLRRPDGREVPVLVSAAPIRDTADAIIGAVVVFEDISSLKELERLREEWTSVIAHDLRQPVTVITGYADLLAMLGQQHPPLPQERAGIEHIQASARQLNRMIGDLLDISRLEAGRLALERQPVDLPSLVHEVVARAAQVTRGHPVSLEVAESIPPVEIDVGRIEQVLGNLLSNAAKYGEPESEIQVVVALRNGEVEVAVTNRGPGIAPEELGKLFTRFHRTRRAQAERTPGLGLGLYIAKGLVEAHGGRIWAESTPGQTTTFRFTLPGMLHSEWCRS